ncbi:30S ribosomal protein S18 [Candidatus Falkowbacteria bacterium]|nr:30S ribosomal protein S18 [Candidatus Falkowbacteria bacterium]
MKRYNNNRSNNRSNTQSSIPKDKQCYFCANNYEAIDYKDAQLLRRFISSYGKIAPRKRSGVCAKHQRKLAEAIKRARVLALLPFISR